MPRLMQRLKPIWPEYIASIDPEDRQEDGFYDIKDIVSKLDSGTASIGLERYYILVEGKGGEHEDLILEMKQAQSSVPVPVCTRLFAGGRRRFTKVVASSPRKRRCRHMKIRISVT